MSKNVLVPLAEGFEEIEAVTIVDILRRAGATVTTAGLHKRNVTGSHGISIIADSVIQEEIDKEWDLVALPGGVPGAQNLAENEDVVTLIQKASAHKKFTAAVCAAPIVLEKAGVIKGKKVTSHPSVEKEIVTAFHQEARTLVDDKIITGQSCGSAMEFAFELVAVLYGEEKVKEMDKSILSVNVKS